MNTLYISFFQTDAQEREKEKEQLENERLVNIQVGAQLGNFVRVAQVYLLYVIYMFLSYIYILSYSCESLKIQNC